MKTKARPRHTMPAGSIILKLLLSILLFAAVLCILSAKWYINTYGQMGFASILYTLLSNLNGVQSGLVRSYLQTVLPTLIVSVVLICLFLFARPGKRLVLTLFHKVRISLYPFSKLAYSCFSLVIAAVLLFHAANLVQLPEYIDSLQNNSTFYEDYYRDPSSTQITFPETKRNLIYIFMESMETTYQSYELGGGNDVNLIPELTLLAQENISFSTSSQFSGGYTKGNTGWTIAAMLAQSSGVPLVLPPGYNGNDYGEQGLFMPGLYALSDLLHEHGYYQMLMVGSDAAFGGRETYYSSHNTDVIYDIYDARKSGLLPSADYTVWWGMEDFYLYECAKAELLKMAEQEQPFAFTMLTVDTHHIDGYVCAQCEYVHDEQYENVISCASKQVSAFVDWLKHQDFYENTTVIICGDHLSMDGAYFSRQGYDSSLRRIYNCVINAPVTASRTKDRLFTSMDMFPTTVAALGCAIEGDRLGLGTNLFSSTPTLWEELGSEVYDRELNKSTNFYFENFFFS